MTARGVAGAAVEAALLEWADNGNGGVVLTGNPFIFTGITGTTPPELVESISLYEPWRMFRIAHNCLQHRAGACITAPADDPEDDDMFDIEVFGTDVLTIRLYAWRGKCRPETVIRFARVCRDLYGDAVWMKTGAGVEVEL